MKSYLFLTLAIASELFGTSMLKASDGFSKIWPALGVIGGFWIRFFLSFPSLKAIPLSVAYAIWSGIGTAATVVIGVLVWKEKINILSILGIAFIIVGVIIINWKTPVRQ